MDVLAKDVMAYYNAYQNNSTTEEPQPLIIQYKDYSVWQNKRLKTDSFNAHRAYWLDKLSGELPVLDLPMNKQRPTYKTNRGHALKSRLDPDTTEKLRNHAKATGGSLFMSVLTVWNVLMYRYTLQEDILIGTPLAGRDHDDLKNQIGFYVNTLPIRNQIKPEESFNDFYEKVKENTVECYTHQMYPFDRLVEELNVQRDTRRNFVIDMLLTLHNKSDVDLDTISYYDINNIDDVVDCGMCTSKYDIELVFTEFGDFISFNLIFNPDVYEKEMSERLIIHFKNLLHLCLSDSETPIADLDFINGDEREDLLINFNDTTVDYKFDNPIIDLFEEQVVKTPDAIALVYQGENLSYNTLNELSNQLANYLKERYDIQRGDLVGINLGAKPKLAHIHIGSFEVRGNIRTNRP